MLAAAFLAAGCSDDGRPSSESSPSSHVSSAASTLRPEADIRVEGDPDVATTLTTAGAASAGVTCSFPSVDGVQIAVLGQPGGTTTTYRIAVSEDEVLVIVDRGSGAASFERSFAGHGVTDFDPTRGATIDATLTDRPPGPGINPGPIGAVRRMSGTIACNDQTPGRSTLTITGDSPSGRYDLTSLEPVTVECYPDSGEVIILGVARTGDNAQLVKVSLTRDGLGVDEELGSAGPRRYRGDASTSTITGDGANVLGDVVDDVSTHTLHVEGTATCGTPNGA